MYSHDYCISTAWWSVCMLGKVWRTLSTWWWGVPWPQAVRVHGGRPTWTGLLSDSVHPGGNVRLTRSTSVGPAIFRVLRSDAEWPTRMSSRCLLFLRKLQHLSALMLFKKVKSWKIYIAHNAHNPLPCKILTTTFFTLNSIHCCKKSSFYFGSNNCQFLWNIF